MARAHANTTLALLVAAIAAARGAAADSTNVAEVRVVRAGSPVSVDGILDEPAWRSAPVIDGFRQRDPNEGAAPSQRTEVRLLYDDHALYVGARMHDTRPDSIVRWLTRRDGQSRSDHFQVYLDPYHDRRTGYYFGVNAAGTLFDGTLSNDGWTDNSWDGVWEGRARIEGQGWNVEIRIPFSQLRFARRDVQTWGINFYRSMGRGFEDSYLVFQPRKESGFVSRFPTMVGLQGVSPGNTLEVVAYGTSKAEYLRHAPLDPFHDGPRTSGNFGSDLRQSLGPLTLNATVNPDFGQVEVDPAVVNLKDVETFFPEKRPFFVEGSSNFDAGQQGAGDYWGFGWEQPTFFYSRRIGRAPQGSLPQGTRFADVPSGTTILGAAKLTGKLARGNFGMLHAITARERADVLRLGAPGAETAEVEPLTWYGVGRYAKEFAERRHGLGVIGTMVARRFDDRRLEREFNRGSFVAALDGWHFLDGDRTWVLSGWAGGSLVHGTAERITAIQTNSRHYFQRPDASGFEVDSAATSLGGLGARVWLNKEKGNWISNSAIGVLSPGFEVNDLGFSNRADHTNAHVGLGYKWTKPTRHVRHHNAIAAVHGGTNFDGDLTSLGAWASKFWWFTNNWVAEIRGSYNPETVNPRRSRGGPRMKDAARYNLGTFADTDGSRVRYYYVSTDWTTSPDEESWSWDVSPGITYKPFSYLSFQAGPSLSRASDGAFLVDRIADPAAAATYGQRYVFARLDQTTFAANLRLNMSFTPAMSLQFFGQPLISTAKFRDLKELARSNSLDFIGPGAGAWTYDPATGLYDPDGPGPAPATSDDFNFKSLRGNMVFRWEYRPGSTFFLVWTQERTDAQGTAEFAAGRSFRRLVDAPADNIFLAKVTYYLSR